jgi:predicted dehydrogenase
MNILIVGRGSIALQHKKNIESYGHEATLFISIFDYTFENDQSIISSFKNSLDSFDAVIVANPSHKHFAFTSEALKKGKKVYLEKPPCLYSHELKKLIELDKNNNLISVGFQMRFSLGLMKLKSLVDENINTLTSFNIHVGQALKYWRDGGINKDSYYADKKTGGGVIYELSHELDMALWIFGRPNKISHKALNLSHKDMNIEDFFHSIWEFNKFSGTVHMDMIDPVYNRYVEVIFSEYKLIWNIDNDSLKKISNKGSEVIYENTLFTRQDLISISMKNFLNYADGMEKWDGARLEESIPLIELFEDIENEK